MSLGAVPGRATAEAVVSPVFAIRARIDHRSKRAFYRSVPLLAVGAGVLGWELRRREVLDSHAETKRRFDAMKIAGVEFYGRATGFSTDRELHEKLQAGDFLFYTRKLSALHAHEAVREIMLRSQFLGWLVAAAGGGGAGLRLDTAGNVIVPQKAATACVDAAQAEATSSSTAAKEAPPSKSSGCPFAPAALASRLRALLPAQGISGPFSSTASGAPASTQPRFVTSSDVPMRVAACASSPDGELCVEGLPYHEWLAQPATGDVVARFVRQRRGAGHHQMGEGGTAETARADKGSTKVEMSLSEFRALLAQRPGVEVVPLMRGDDESFVTVSEGTAPLGKRDGGKRKRDEALLVQINGQEVSVTDAKLGAEVIVR